MDWEREREPRERGFVRKTLDGEDAYILSFFRGARAFALVRECIFISFFFYFLFFFRNPSLKKKAKIQNTKIYRLTYIDTHIPLLRLSFHTFKLIHRILFLWVSYAKKQKKIYIDPRI